MIRKIAQGVRRPSSKQILGSWIFSALYEAWMHFTLHEADLKTSLNSEGRPPSCSVVFVMYVATVFLRLY